MAILKLEYAGEINLGASGSSNELRTNYIAVMDLEDDPNDVRLAIKTHITTSPAATPVIDNIPASTSDGLLMEDFDLEQLTTNVWKVECTYQLSSGGTSSFSATSGSISVSYSQSFISQKVRIANAQRALYAGAAPGSDKIVDQKWINVVEGKVVGDSFQIPVNNINIQFRAPVTLFTPAYITSVKALAGHCNHARLTIDGIQYQKGELMMKPFTGSKELSSGSADSTLTFQFAQLNNIPFEVSPGTPRTVAGIDLTDLADAEAPNVGLFAWERVWGKYNEATENNDFVPDATAIYIYRNWDFVDFSVLNFPGMTSP